MKRWEPWQYWWSLRMIVAFLMTVVGVVGPFPPGASILLAFGGVFFQLFNWWQMGRVVKRKEAQVEALKEKRFNKLKGFSE